MKTLSLSKILFVSFLLLLFNNNCYSQTQIEINDQASADYRDSDAKLNKVYNQLIKLVTSKKEKALLIKSEHAWIAFRDAQANFKQEQYDGGSMQASLYFAEMKDLTTARIKQLEEAIADKRR
jgi:uncharacterized protein YecT (DUF1311 family)